MTTNEQVLFSIFLTLASSLLSWVVSHYYYEESHSKTIEEIKRENLSNLKIYATKAAEKVRNLSSQLLGLVTYLNEELASEDYNSAEENLRAKEERIYSTIHIIQTLKSINDGSLSDWSGVIPEEIQEIKAEDRQTLEELSDLATSLEELKLRHQEELGFQMEDVSDEQNKKIEILSKKIDLLLTSVTGVTSRPTKSTYKKEKIKKDCPECGFVVEYRQKPLVSSRKFIKCEECGTKLLSTWNLEEGFLVEVKSQSDHTVDEGLVESVRVKLPPQPWPKGISSLISQDLNVSHTKVTRAINTLIKRGVFKRQTNGILSESAFNKQIQKDVSIKPVEEFFL